MTMRNPPPTRPKEFGEELKRLREASGLSLDDISAETKVSIRVLGALESGSFQYLPEQVFSRNFVRQYARTIGYDERRLIDAFDEAWEGFQIESGTHPDLIVEEAPPKESIRWGFWFPLAVGVLILITVAWVILTGTEPGEELISRDSAAVRTGSPRMPDPTSVPRVPSVVPIVQQPEHVVEPEEHEVSLTVRVSSGKECWIQFRDRDGVTADHLLRGGDELALVLDGPVMLTIGNAAAARVLVGSTEYVDLGAPGQVVHTEVTRDGLTRLGIGSRDG
jgi:transcriptional regulator with XRE-family HTH domain